MKPNNSVLHLEPRYPLTDGERHRAAVMWAEGKNTCEIARELSTVESRVFNDMDNWMPRARKLREWRAMQVQRVGKILSSSPEGG